MREETERWLTGLRLGALDWVRFGQLLRDRLGWDDYPGEPPSEEEINPSPTG